MWKIVIASLCGLIAGWLLRHYLKTFKTPEFRSDTTRFFKSIKSSGNRFKFYTMPTLIGTLLVSLSVLNVALNEVTDFMVIEDKGGVVGQRRYELLRIKEVIAALTTWYAFINPAWQRARQKQEQENLDNSKNPE